MNQEIDDKIVGKNRFIFANDFYDKLSETSNTDDNNLIKVDDSKTHQFDSVLKENNEKEVMNKPDFLEKNTISDLSNDNLNKITDNEKNNINTPNLLNGKVSLTDENEASNKSLNDNIALTNNQSKSDNVSLHNLLNTKEENKEEDNNFILNRILNAEQNSDNTISNSELNNKESEKENIQKSTILEVETGINTALEQEILNYQSEPVVEKPEIISNTMWGEEYNKKVAYKATRNPIKNINNIETVPDLDNEIPEKETMPPIKPAIPEIENWKPSTPPPIIIQDDELDKLKIETKEKEIKKLPAVKSDLLEKLTQKEKETGKISILARYGDDFCSYDYITNPAIGRQEEIKQLTLTLLTPEKSAILVGKPGIGKTSIVEGLAYCLQRNNVPNALSGYVIVSVKSASLLGSLPTGETRLQTLIDELKTLDKVILFIDEIHMLMGATDESSLDFANMFKESLGRGNIKMIGATTDAEYERYVLRDKAFVRRFQRIDVEEPTKEQTIKIMMGTLPKIEKNIGAKLKYSNYIQTEIMSFIVDITTEYKRIYGIGSRYPDICLTLLSQAFSQAVFDNREEVNIFDIRKAIENSKNIYPDVIRKELINFDEKFKQIINEEKNEY